MTEGERAELNKVIQVRVNPARVPRNVRVCTFSHLTAKDMELAIKKWLYVLKELAAWNSTLEELGHWFTMDPQQFLLAPFLCRKFFESSCDYCICLHYLWDLSTIFTWSWKWFFDCVLALQSQLKLVATDFCVVYGLLADASSDVQRVLDARGQRGSDDLFI